MQRFWKYVLMFSLFLSASVALAAPVTQQIPFTKTTPLEVPETYTFRFSLWDIATGGTAGANRVWWEIKDIDMATKTLTTNLGNVASAAKRSGPLSEVDFSEQYWVQVEKLGTNGTTWTVVGTRTKFNVVPYAMWSAQGGDAISVTAGGGLTGAMTPDGDITLNVGAGDGISVGPDTVSVKAGTYVKVAGDTMTGTLILPANGLVAGTNQLVLTGGIVGIGIETPINAKLVVGTATESTGIAGRTSVTNGKGVLGASEYGAFAMGLYGLSSQGIGVYGNGGNYGGYFLGPKTYVDGNLGVGVSVPAYKLDVAGPANLNKGLTGVALRVNGSEALWFNGTYFSWGYGGTTTYNYFARKVGIGTVTPGWLLTVNGFAAKPGGGSWTDSSDIRLKKNVRPLDGALDKMLGLRGVEYEWIDPERAAMLPGFQMGMIAQEVDEVFPQWVGTDQDGYKDLTFRGFEALTVESMRELKAENETLKEQLRSQEERLARLEALMTAK